MAHTAAVNLQVATITAGVMAYGDVTVTSDTDPIHVTGITVFPSSPTYPIKFTLQLIPTAGGGAGPDPDNPQNTMGTVTLDTNNTYEPSGPSPVGTTWVAGGGTLAFPFNYVAYHPQGIAQSATIDIDAQVELSDGTILNATAATLTVNSPQSVAYDP